MTLVRLARDFSFSKFGAPIAATSVTVTHEIFLNRLSASLVDDEDFAISSAIATAGCLDTINASSLVSLRNSVLETNAEISKHFQQIVMSPAPAFKSFGSSPIATSRL